MSKNVKQVFYVDTSYVNSRSEFVFPYTQKEMNSAVVMRVVTSIKSKKQFKKRFERLRRKVSGKVVTCSRYDDFLDGNGFNKKDLKELQDLWSFSLLHGECKKEEICILLEKTKAQQGGYSYLIKTPKRDDEDLKIFGGYTGYLEIYTRDRYAKKQMSIRLEKSDLGRGSAVVYYGIYRKDDCKYINRYHRS